MNVGQSRLRSPAVRGTVMIMRAFKRIGQPSDVAGVLAFLGSDGARWMPAASVLIDGDLKR